MFNLLIQTTSQPVGTLMLECHAFQTLLTAPLPVRRASQQGPDWLFCFQLSLWIPRAGEAAWHSPPAHDISNAAFSASRALSECLIYIYLYFVFTRGTGAGLWKGYSEGAGSIVSMQSTSRAPFSPCPRHSAHLRPGSWEGVYITGSSRNDENQSSRVSIILAVCLTPDGHPVRPFCFALFLLTLWIKPGASLGLLTTPNTNYS